MAFSPEGRIALNGVLSFVISGLIQVFIEAELANIAEQNNITTEEGLATYLNSHPQADDALRPMRIMSGFTAMLGVAIISMAGLIRVIKLWKESQFRA